MMFRVCSILLLLIAIPFSVSAASVKPQKRYLTRENVDTTILNGFYVLTEASSVAGVGFRQKEALETAKRLAQDLREKAKGDPNERYILWKVGELEAQVYMEEKDLLLQKIQQGQITVNDYIARYNTEVGKKRPDFATLKKIYVQMSEIDVQKGNELADSYNQRYRAISREVLFSIEKAVIEGDVNKARDELGYCLRNKNYLSISDAQYSQAENRVEGLTKAYQEKPFIESEADSAVICIKFFELNRARTFISSARYRLQNANSYFPPNISSNLALNIDIAERLLVHREDSLVHENLSILSKQGIKAADAFLQKILKPCGISREKAAYVDSLMLIISSPEKTKMTAEIENTVSSGDETNGIFDDIRETARKKAQVKLDSIRLADEIRLQQIQAEKAHNDSVLAAQYETQKIELQKSQEKASSITQDIYTLIEQNNLKDANSLFLKEKDFLKQYMFNEAFSMLETTIEQSMAPRAPQQVAYVTPVAVTQNEPAPAPGSNELLQKNQDRAQREITALYAMLEKNEIKDAYNKFQSIKKPLQQYLDKEVFDLLETTIVQAYSYLPNENK